MKQMKRILSMILAFCLLATLVACKKEEQKPIPEPIPEETPAIPESAYDTLVTEAHHQIIGAGEFFIPQINYGSADCEAINTQIWETFHDGIVANITPDDPLFAGDGIFYEWTVQNEVLSLVIEDVAAEIGRREIYVYTIDLSDGTAMAVDEVVAKAGLVYPDYQTKLHAAVEAQFYKNMSVTDSADIDENYMNLFNDTLQKTLSEDNMKAAYPYFNRDGQLCTAIKLYSVAGPEYFWGILNLTVDPAESADQIHRNQSRIAPVPQEPAIPESLEEVPVTPENQEIPAVPENPEVVENPEAVPAVPQEAEILAEEVTQTP